MIAGACHDAWLLQTGWDFSSDPHSGIVPALPIDPSFQIPGLASVLQYAKKVVCFPAALPTNCANQVGRVEESLKGNQTQVTGDVLRTG